MELVIETPSVPSYILQHSHPNGQLLLLLWQLS